MTRYILRYPSSSKRQSIEIGERIGGGGAGDIYQIPDAPGHVLKVYKTDKDRTRYAPKLEAMIERAPVVSLYQSSDKSFPPLAWPVALAETKQGSFVGFSMPEIVVDKSVSLERMLQKKMRTVSGLSHFYGWRVAAAYYLAATVAAVHKNKHYIIDLKPNNCRVHKKKMLISIVDCDGFNISGKDGKRFPAQQFSVDYVAPEFIKKKPEHCGEEQDLFALAVIIFKLLNNGLHPFQAHIPGEGSAITTIHQMVENKYYAYGIKGNKKCFPVRQSIHEGLPDDLRQLFDQAFETVSRPKAEKWRDILREYATPATGKLVRCDKAPNEHAHFGKGCPWCKLDAKNQTPIQQQSQRSPKNLPPQTPIQQQSQRSPKNLPPQTPMQQQGGIPLAKLSKSRSRLLLFFTISAMVLMLGFWQI